MATTPVRWPTPPGPSTCTGVRLHGTADFPPSDVQLLVLGAPSWPDSLSPQAQPLPSFFAARHWSPPAAIARTLVKKPDPPVPCTRSGARPQESDPPLPGKVQLSVLGAPSWPKKFAPQDHVTSVWFPWPI